MYEVEAREGRIDLLPDYVDDITLAQHMGIPPWELMDAPSHWIEKYRIVLAAQHAAQKKGQ